MIVAISKFEIQNGMEQEVKDAFKNRPGLVENAKGFLRMDVLSPINNTAEIHLITYWESEEDFEYWHHHHLKESHKNIPKGLKLVPKSWNKRELMRKNQKIELLNKELKAVNENMTVFTYSVSHDLKEPVRIIKSFLTLLHKNYGSILDPKGQTYLDKALDGASRLSKMMADLMKFHQSSNIRTTESVDMNEVLLEVKYILQKEIEEKKAQISSEKLPLIKGSSAGIRQVFQNLISNAIKFVPEGKIPIISIEFEEDNTHYTIRVKDNGIGIAKNQGHEVFNLFKRLNDPQLYEGTGMGLAMVRKSIERMGGKVWLESAEGKGSTFFFTIPKSYES